jgi:L-histidine N-alpha-methyltransferase
MTQQLLSLVRLANDGDLAAELADDVQRGLTSAPRTLPSRYFYDARGSELFEQITHLPEYYQTRTELQVLQHVAGNIIAEVAPAQIVELGSGSSRKTRVLLDAMRAAGTGDLYVPVDVSEDALRGALAGMTATLPWLRIAGVVGDFRKHLGVVPREGCALVIFLGSTVGNFHPNDQQAFVDDIAGALQPGDAFLLGVDLVPGPRKTVAELEAAYDDAQGVTAAFNRNILSVIGRHLRADINPDDFAHVARYDAGRRWIEMLLRARRDLTLRLPGIALDVPLAAGEDIRTEISCKFTREWVSRLFDRAGIPMRRWDTDPDGRFALALGCKPA